MSQPQSVMGLNSTSIEYNRLELVSEGRGKYSAMPISPFVWRTHDNTLNTWVQGLTVIFSFWLLCCILCCIRPRYVDIIQCCCICLKARQSSGLKASHQLRFIFVQNVSMTVCIFIFIKMFLLCLSVWLPDECIRRFVLIYRYVLTAPRLEIQPS